MIKDTRGATPACGSAHARKTGGANEADRGRRSDKSLPRGTVWY